MFSSLLFTLNNIPMIIKVFCVGVVVGALLFWLLKRWTDYLNRITVLRVMKLFFGDTVYSSTLTLADVVDWIEARRDKAPKGSRVFVTKNLGTILKMLGEHCDVKIKNRGFKKFGNHLVIAIMNGKSKVDATVFNYINLDQDLIEELDKSGNMIVDF